MQIRKIIQTVASGDIKGHFGQWAEDVLVRKLFSKNQTKGVYLDLGAYHPFKHSNTAYFWLKGWKGINVDANPNTIHIFNKVRKHDINIWAAIIQNNQYNDGLRNIDLMIAKNKDYSSGISATGTVHPQVSNDRQLTDKITVPTTCIQEIFKNYNIEDIDYLNIDIEGYDSLIIKDYDFSLYKPKVITIEDYSINLQELIISDISIFLFSKGYDLVGRAGPTSVFYLC